MSTFASLLPLLFGPTTSTPGVDAAALDPSSAGRPGAIGSWFIRTDTGGWYSKTGAADTDWTLLGSGTGGSQTWFGNGADGDVTLGAGTTTLVRDMYYDNLTVPNGATLAPDGYRIFCRTSLTVEAGGAILNDGPAASGRTGGNFGYTGGQRTLGWGEDGGAGGIAGANGAAGDATEDTPLELPDPICRGGAGGTGAGGVELGGAAGAIVHVPAASGGPWALPWLMEGAYPATGEYLPGGSGGGGGGGGTAGSGVGRDGGGGGAGGGVIVIVAQEIVNDGVIGCRGGAGANGAAIGNGGGGGGGGGGAVYVVTQSYTGNDPDVSGGAAGAGAGTGANGSAGNTGYYFIFEGV